MSESSEKTDTTKRSADKRGILRLDINKPRNSSGSVEFRNPPELISEVKSIYFKSFIILQAEYIINFFFIQNACKVKTI